MCLRISEVAGYTFEYYPGTELDVLTKLYSGEFAGDGLTVESLVESMPTRRFQNLEGLGNEMTDELGQRVHG